VTTEDDFQSALDANPNDWQTRLIFADRLDERSDRRADGYRALGMQRLRPNAWHQNAGSTHWWWGGDRRAWRDNPNIAVLPPDWFEALAAKNCADDVWPVHDDPNTRREAEDATAHAFAALPAERRSDLLAPQTEN
jgi:uncharacterized protein (TIGR02996 family)